MEDLIKKLTFETSAFGVRLESKGIFDGRQEIKITRKEAEIALDALFYKKNHEKTKDNLLSDKEIEDYIWENFSDSLCQEDRDNLTDAYKKYTEAVYWAKWARDNYNVI